MHKDFHLYGTFLAAVMAGYNVNDAQDIAFAAQKVDEFGRDRAKFCYTETPMYSEVAKSIFKNCFLKNIESAFSISRTWMPFHFVPRNPVGDSLENDNSIRFACGDGTPMAEICGKLIPGGEDEGDVINLERIGITMHVLADSYAHQEFAGITCYNPRIVQNIELLYGEQKEGLGAFDHVPVWMSKILSGCCYYGHGSAGHIPDLSWAEYNYWWTGVPEIKNAENQDWRSNPDIFVAAFLRMVDVMIQIRRGRDRESEQPFQPEALLDFLMEGAGKIRRSYSNVRDWNLAVNEAEMSLPMDVIIKQRQCKALSPDETRRYENAKRTKIILHQYDDAGNYQAIEVTAGDLLGKTKKSNSFEESSDTLFEQFYEAVKKPHWLSAEQLELRYEDYLKDKKKDAVFEDAAVKHRAAVYHAIGIDDSGLKALLKREFSMWMTGAEEDE